MTDTSTQSSVTWQRTHLAASCAAVHVTAQEAAESVPRRPRSGRRARSPTRARPDAAVGARAASQRAPGVCCCQQARTDTPRACSRQAPTGACSHVIQAHAAVAADMIAAVAADMIALRRGPFRRARLPALPARATQSVMSPSDANPGCLGENSPSAPLGAEQSQTLLY